MPDSQQLHPVPAPCCTLDLEPDEKARFVAMSKAIGNPIRFEILDFLLTHPGCITGDLVDHLPIAQATVSQHLKVLRDTGWISGTVQGPATCYCLSPDNIRWYRAKVAAIL